MKILITADVHGNLDLLDKIKESYDLHIDAGDIVTPEHILDVKGIISVRGNCDHYSKLPMERLLNYDNKTFLVLHGHNFDVKYGLERLINYAKMKKADYCIFGHTHIQSLFIEDNITFINPGALINKPLEYAIYEDGKITLKKE